MRKKFRLLSKLAANDEEQGATAHRRGVYKKILDEVSTNATQHCASAVEFRKQSVFFVCTGNTCRSPMAEALFAKMMQGRHDVVALSAGLQATPGTPANPIALKVLAQEHGVDFSSFKSQPVTAALVEGATAVFAMTLDHLCTLSQRYPEHRQKFFLLNENGKDIPDPIGGSTRTYEECCAAIQSSLQNLLARLANN